MALRYQSFSTNAPWSGASKKGERGLLQCLDREPPSPESSRLETPTEAAALALTTPEGPGTCLQAVSPLSAPHVSSTDALDAFAMQSRAAEAEHEEAEILQGLRSELRALKSMRGADAGPEDSSEAADAGVATDAGATASSVDVADSTDPCRGCGDLVVAAASASAAAAAPHSARLVNGTALGHVREEADEQLSKRYSTGLTAATPSLDAETASLPRLTADGPLRPPSGAHAAADPTHLRRAQSALPRATGDADAALGPLSPRSSSIAARLAATALSPYLEPVGSPRRRPLSTPSGSAQGIFPRSLTSERRLGGEKELAPRASFAHASGPGSPGGALQLAVAAVSAIVSQQRAMLDAMADLPNAAAASGLPQISAGGQPPGSPRLSGSVRLTSGDGEGAVGAAKRLKRQQTVEALRSEISAVKRGLAQRLEQRSEAERQRGLIDRLSSQVEVLIGSVKSRLAHTSSEAALAAARGGVAAGAAPGAVDVRQEGASEDRRLSDSPVELSTGSLASAASSMSLEASPSSVRAPASPTSLPASPRSARAAASFAGRGRGRGGRAASGGRGSNGGRSSGGRGSTPRTPRARGGPRTPPMEWTKRSDAVARAAPAKKEKAGRRAAPAQAPAPAAAAEMWCEQLDTLAEQLGGSYEPGRPWHEMLRDLLAPLPVATLCVTTDPGLPIAWVNSAFEALTGYSQADAAGRSCRFLQGKGTERPAVRLMVKHLRAGTTMPPIVVTNYTKGGDEFSNVLTLHPVHDSAGKYSYVVGVLLRKDQHESHLGTLARRLRELLPRTFDASLQRAPPPPPSLTREEAPEQVREWLEPVVAFTQRLWSLDTEACIACLVSYALDSEAHAASIIEAVERYARGSKRTASLGSHRDLVKSCFEAARFERDIGRKAAEARACDFYSRASGASEPLQGRALLKQLKKHAELAASILAAEVLPGLVQSNEHSAALIRSLLGEPFGGAGGAVGAGGAERAAWADAARQLLWEDYTLPADCGGFLLTFCSVAEYFPACIVVSDMAMAGNPMVYVNRQFCKVTGYSREEVAGLNCRFLQGPRTEPAAVAHIQDTLRRGVDCFVRITNYRKDGSSFVNLLSLRPVHDSNGVYRFCIGVQFDATVSPRNRMDRLTASPHRRSIWTLHFI